MGADDEVGAFNALGGVRVKPGAVVAAYEAEGARMQREEAYAAALFFSRRAVTGHVTAILAKLGVDNRTAAATAVRDGLV